MLHVSTAHDGANADPHKSYNGLRHAFKTIVNESGWKGLYQVIVSKVVLIFSGHHYGLASPLGNTPQT